MKVKCGCYMALITVYAGIYTKDETVTRDRYLTFIKVGKSANIDKRMDQHRVNYNAVNVELLCWMDTSNDDRDSIEATILKTIKLKNLKCSIGIITYAKVIFPSELALVTMDSIDIFIKCAKDYKYPLYKVSALIEDDTSEFIDDVYDYCVDIIQENECTKCLGELQDIECYKCNDTSVIQDDAIVLCDEEDSVSTENIYIMSQNSFEWIEKNMLNKKSDRNKYTVVSQVEESYTESDMEFDTESDTEYDTESDTKSDMKSDMKLKDIPNDYIYSKLSYNAY